MHSAIQLSRRGFLAGTAAAGAGAAFGALGLGADDPSDPAANNGQALVAITLDLEMSRNFPTWETTHWDYEKGNLDEDTKQYALEAARRLHRRGARLHFFAVGRVLEQENIEWLQEIVAAGHPVGNHTYDHVNVTATRAEDIQFRFQRAPWLIAGREPTDVIRENIRLANLALEDRLGIKPAGFRTPGGFANGLADRPDVQAMLMELGFPWVSSKYPAHAMTKPGEPPSQAVLSSIVEAQAAAQPLVYPSGLIEVPMSPVSDIGAFRNGRWPLEEFLKAVRLGVAWAIEHRAVFDFLGHPSCLAVTDPEFRTIDLICDLVEHAGDKAVIVDLGTIARRAKLRAPQPG